MAFLRMMFGLPLAAVVTLGLFAMMAGLIGKEQEIGTPRIQDKILVTAQLEPSEPRPQVQSRPDLLKDVPDPVTTDPSDRPGRPESGSLPVLPADPGQGEKPVIRSGTTIKVPPPYPAACQRFAVEGEVVVQFDVTDRGEVVNVRILSSTHRCFERDVIKAVSGWRYPPEARRGLVEKFVFRLTE